MASRRSRSLIPSSSETEPHPYVDQLAPGRKPGPHPCDRDRRVRRFGGVRAVRAARHAGWWPRHADGDPVQRARFGLQRRDHGARPGAWSTGRCASSTSRRWRWAPSAGDCSSSSSSSRRCRSRSPCCSRSAWACSSGWRSTSIFGRRFFNSPRIVLTVATIAALPVRGVLRPEGAEPADLPAPERPHGAGTDRRRARPAVPAFQRLALQGRRLQHDLRVPRSPQHRVAGLRRGRRGVLLALHPGRRGHPGPGRELRTRVVARYPGGQPLDAWCGRCRRAWRRWA